MARFIKRWSVVGVRLSVFGALFLSVGSARAQDASTLLSAPKLPPYKWFASTDPKHQNADYVLLKPGEMKRIPLSAGVLLRLWSTAFEPQNLRLVLQNGNQQTELLSGGKAKFGELYEKAFTFYPTPSTPAAVHELKSNAVLIATNKSKVENKWYYQATVRPYETKASLAARKNLSERNRESKSWPSGPHALMEWGDWKFKPGANKFDSLLKQDTITSIYLDFEPHNYKQASSLYLQIKWDNSPTKFEIPLLAFAGIIGSSQPRAANSNEGKLDYVKIQLPLSYGEGTQFTIINKSNKEISAKHAQVVTSFFETSPYRLCMASGSARSQKGKPIPILKVQGEGAFVGLVLDIRPAPDAFRRTFAFLEGNETLIADGQKYEGTGTEDYFNSAWYYPEKPFLKSYHGMTLKSTAPPRVTAYRWMIPDAVPFQKNFEFNFEHGNGNNSGDLEFRWVAFWYQKPSAKFEIVDALKSGVNGSGSTPTGGAIADDPKLFIFVVLATAVGAWGLWIARRRRQL